MVDIRIDYAGLPANLSSRVQQTLNTIVNDNTTRIFLDNRVDTLTITFAHLGANAAFGIANNETANPTIRFNLDRLSSTLGSNGDVVFDQGKPFFELR